MADTDTDASTPCRRCAAGQHSEQGSSRCLDCAAGSVDEDADPSTIWCGVRCVL
jgi:hypothetical protein